MEKEAMRAAKLDQRLAVLTKGYVTREAAHCRGIETAWQALQAAEQVCTMLYTSVHSPEYHSPTAGAGPGGGL